MTLDVMLVTTADRVGRMAPLPAVEGVRYIVSVQDPHFKLTPEALEALERPDVDVRIYHDSGLSVNRNHALEAATADIVMVADDDLIFHPDGLHRLIELYEQDAELDWVTARAEMPENHIYPPDGWNLEKTYRFYVPTSFEMSFRRVSLPADMRFSTLAGIGAPYLGAGEDDLFYHHARKAGLQGRFADIRVVSHTGPTTDEHSAATAAFVRTKGAMMYVMRGFWPGLIRIPLEASRSRLPFFEAMKELVKGFVYGIKHRKEL